MVESEVAQWGKSSFSVTHKLFRGETLAVEGFEKRVWTVRVGDRPHEVQSKAVPKEIIDKFS
jgi:4-hydroxybenzoyl-CoA thioesterase